LPVAHDQTGKSARPTNATVLWGGLPTALLRMTSGDFCPGPWRVGRPGHNGSRPQREHKRRKRQFPLLSHHVVEDLFLDVNGQIRLAGDSHGNRVRGPRVDLDQLAFVADTQEGEISVLLKLVDHHVL
jgi:hypothetical protein